MWYQFGVPHHGLHLHAGCGRRRVVRPGTPRRSALGSPATGPPATDLHTQHPAMNVPRARIDRLCRPCPLNPFLLVSPQTLGVTCSLRLAQMLDAVEKGVLVAHSPSLQLPLASADHAPNVDQALCGQRALGLLLDLMREGSQQRRCKQQGGRGNGRGPRCECKTGLGSPLAQASLRRSAEYTKGQRA